jgi:hypothetical protein
MIKVIPLYALLDVVILDTRQARQPRQWTATKEAGIDVIVG